MVFRSILKPSESVVAGAATVGFVIAVYQMNLGTAAQVHATDANHPVLESSRKKAGYTALAGATPVIFPMFDLSMRHRRQPLQDRGELLKVGRVQLLRCFLRYTPGQLRKRA